MAREIISLNSVTTATWYPSLNTTPTFSSDEIVNAIGVSVAYSLPGNEESLLGHLIYRCRLSADHGDTFEESESLHQLLVASLSDRMVVDAVSASYVWNREKWVPYLDAMWYNEECDNDTSLADLEEVSPVLRTTTYRRSRPIIVSKFTRDQESDMIDEAREWLAECEQPD